MLGMHGTAYANKAVVDCDLVMSVGSRWDDRITGTPDTFCPDALKIHVDIDPAEINKLYQMDCAIVGDARAVLAQLNRQLSPGDTQAWRERSRRLEEGLPPGLPQAGDLRGAIRDRRAVPAHAGQGNRHH